MTIRRITFIPRDLLLTINNNSVSAGLSKTLVPQRIRDLDPDLRAVVYTSFPHNDNEVRTLLMLSPSVVVLLDMSYEEFNRLPVLEIDDDASEEPTPADR